MGFYEGIRRSDSVIGIPPELFDEVDRLASTWESEDKIQRLWSGDTSIWSGSTEGQQLGWLRIIEKQRRNLDSLLALKRDAEDSRFERAVLLGMGGSSLCPEVLRQVFGRMSGRPDLRILDSTDPAQIAATEKAIDYQRTLFIVSSKSGTTLESNMLARYFFERVSTEFGSDVGDRFVAVTDPGSPLDEIAVTRKFRHVFHGWPNIGGRFSALSNFGLVPAAVMGLDISRFLDRAEVMRARCGATTPVRENPAAMLGLILGAAAKEGRDKITFIASRSIRSFGAWLEQLLAESTGKGGTGLVPVNGEVLRYPELYGEDRCFVYLRDKRAEERDQDAAVKRLEEAGFPVVHLSLTDSYELGGEFFRWEFATAVVGAILGINPFDQPDVEESKVRARRFTQTYERGGEFPNEKPLACEGNILVYGSTSTGEASEKGGTGPSVTQVVAWHLRKIVPGDYVGLMAYLERSQEHVKMVEGIRDVVRCRLRVATCADFGPRFLHSTGQLHKGGPNTGVFFQITCSDEVDISVPGEQYSFGVVKMAQARGDFEALVNRNRRVLRVHVTGSVLKGLQQFAEIVDDALIVNTGL
jgi:transaldolase/glucose-6-phosphate isomerase